MASQSRAGQRASVEPLPAHPAPARGSGLSAAARGLARLAANVPRAALRRLSLFQQFMLLSFAILVVGAYIIGSYVASEIEARVIHRTSAIAALYVESFVSPHLQELSVQETLSSEHFAQLDALLSATPLGEEIVSFKIWGKDGRVVYATETGLIGRRFSSSGALTRALGGDIQAEMSDLKEEENLYERQRWSRLLETYAPVRADETGEIIGVAEFYQDQAALESEIASSQRKGWLIVGGATGVMYLLLVGMVRGASTTIARQHRRLEELAGRNADLASRVRRAAAQKAETDEQLLMRIAQDLHDGPAQDISLALLRLEAIGGQQTADGAASTEADAALVRTALAAALKEIREIAGGLRLPEMEGLSLRRVVEKAVEEHQEKTGDRVKLVAPPELPVVDLPVKIAIYRVAQEALNNAHLHAGVGKEEVEVQFVDRAVRLEIRDRGAGLKESARDKEGEKGRSTLGLRGMRERVEMLGGWLELLSEPGRGTTVRAIVPLSRDEG